MMFDIIIGVGFGVLLILAYIGGSLKVLPFLRKRLPDPMYDSKKNYVDRELVKVDLEKDKFNTKNGKLLLVNSNTYKNAVSDNYLEVKVLVGILKTAIKASLTRLIMRQSSGRMYSLDDLDISIHRLVLSGVLKSFDIYGKGLKIIADKTMTNILLNMDIWSCIPLSAARTVEVSFSSDEHKKKRYMDSYPFGLQCKVPINARKNSFDVPDTSIMIVGMSKDKGLIGFYIDVIEDKIVIHNNIYVIVDKDNRYYIKPSEVVVPLDINTHAYSTDNITRDIVETMLPYRISAMHTDYPYERYIPTRVTLGN